MQRDFVLKIILKFSQFDGVFVRGDHMTRTAAPGEADDLARVDVAILMMIRVPPVKFDFRVQRADRPVKRLRIPDPADKADFTVKEKAFIFPPSAEDIVESDGFMIRLHDPGAPSLLPADLPKTGDPFRNRFRAAQDTAVRPG